MMTGACEVNMSNANWSALRSVVNGTIKVTGKVPSIPEIKTMLQQAAA